MKRRTGNKLGGFCQLSFKTPNLKKSLYSLWSSFPCPPYPPCPGVPWCPCPHLSSPVPTCPHLFSPVLTRPTAEELAENSNVQDAFVIAVEQQARSGALKHANNFREKELDNEARKYIESGCTGIPVHGGPGRGWRSSPRSGRSNPWT